MKALKRVLGSLRKADVDFHMIEDGDRICVGISGGKDSSALLHCLNLYKMFSGKNYEIIGVYIDLGFGNADISPLQEYFSKQNVTIRYETSHIYDILKLHPDSEGKIECSLCSKLRKGALVNIAKALACNKVAFGHHSDDAVETLYMNMIHGGRIATFKPNMLLERSGVWLIRPLVYAFENDISKMVKDLEIPVVKNNCPNAGHTERESVKGMLKELYHRYPEARNNFQLMLRNTDQLSLFEKEDSD